MWTFIVRSPSRAPFEYKLKAGKNTLGRNPDNHIIISDESASRLHAEIYCQDGLAIIYDLGSTNGTYVNRERIIKPHVLQSGDQIRIGRHVIIATCHNGDTTQNLVAALSGTQPLTRDLVLESIDQNAIFLDSVACRLTTILDLETALQEIADLVRVAIGADKTGIVLAKQFNNMQSLGLPDDIAEQAIEQHSVVVVPSQEFQIDQKKSDATKTHISAALCVPVIIEKEVVALLYAYKTDASANLFTRHDVQLAVAISHQTALSIQRAKFLEESQAIAQLAFTDSLTGLHNRRQILNLLDKEFQRARRYHHPLAVLALDLDGLKQINDTYGHQVGDQALIMVAESCKRQLRDVDSIGRYGGDEFIILLVETDITGGHAFAERIQQNIASAVVNSLLAPVKVTVTIGVASLTDKTSEFNNLLNKADKALIAAKKLGKNQIMNAK
jgi:diguanylate cyclase (GGDEF)-like protein